MHFNKCLQMFTFPQHILIVAAPNWSSLVHYDESGTVGSGGGAARSGQQLELLADSGHPGLGHHPAPEPHATRKARMLPGGPITLSTSKQPPACQGLTGARWKVGRPCFELIMATVYYCPSSVSDVGPSTSGASSPSLTPNPVSESEPGTSHPR